MQFRTEQNVAGALPVTFGVRYSIIKTLPTGEVTEVDAKQELDRNDGVQIRFQANEAGYLYVLQRDSQKNWQPFASQRIQPPTPVDIPPKDTVRVDSAGTKEFFAVFSRLALTNLNLVRALAGSAGSLDQQQVFAAGNVGGTRAVITTVSEPASQQVAFPITLKYK
jgi:hypothetical protein